MKNEKLIRKEIIENSLIQARLNVTDQSIPLKNIQTYQSADREVESQIKSKIVNEEILKIRKQVKTFRAISGQTVVAGNELQRFGNESFWNNPASDKMKYLVAVVNPLLCMVLDDN
jgi:hypothetical protein